MSRFGVYRIKSPITEFFVERWLKNPKLISVRIGSRFFWFRKK